VNQAEGGVEAAERPAPLPRPDRSRRSVNRVGNGAEASNRSHVAVRRALRTFTRRSRGPILGRTTRSKGEGEGGIGRFGEATVEEEGGS